MVCDNPLQIDEWNSSIYLAVLPIDLYIEADEDLSGHMFNEQNF